MGSRADREVNISFADTALCEAPVFGDTALHYTMERGKKNKSRRIDGVLIPCFPCSLHMRDKILPIDVGQKGGMPMAKQKKEPKPGWYQLDNAGVLYSARSGEVLRRLPLFGGDDGTGEPRCAPAGGGEDHAAVSRLPGEIKRGAFWYYLEPNNAPGPFVKRDISNPLPARPLQGGQRLAGAFLLRAPHLLEVFHALSDGGGALVFARCWRCTCGSWGTPSPTGRGVLDNGRAPRPEDGGRYTPDTQARRSCGAAGLDGLSQQRARRSRSTR